jgi:Flp pilus assembly protein TadD
MLQQEAQRLIDAGSLKAADEKNLEATVEYRKALERRPNFPEAHENLGVAFYNLGRAADAIREYELAIAQTQKPGAPLFTNYGMALLMSNRFREAGNAFSRAIEYQPNDVDLYYYKGFSLNFAGDNEGSRSAFLQYLRVAPAGQHAKDVREILDGRATPTLKGGSRR